MKERIERALVKLGLQKCAVFEYEITDSTNTRAKLFAKNRGAEEKSPAIFVARGQYAGRGTRGRTFESPVGAGVYISALVYEKILPSEAQRLTATAAVAIRRTIEALAPCDAARRVGIKWVNDLYFGNRKLAGILTEGEVTPEGELAYAIIGVGLNVLSAPHSKEVADIIATLADLGVSADPCDVCALAVCEIFKALCEPWEKIRAEYKAHSLLIGRDVRINDGGLDRVERVLDIDADCALITTGEDGRQRRYLSATVTPVYD